VCLALRSVFVFLDVRVSVSVCVTLNLCVFLQSEILGTRDASVNPSVLLSFPVK